MSNQIAKRVGRAFTINRQWFVEEQDGSEIPVVGGDIGRTHNVLKRSKDENRQVYYDRIAGWASVSGFRTVRDLNG